jgi:transcriptional regulator GlxA family with amidase domain
MPTSYRRPARPLRLGLLLYPGCMPAGLYATADMVRACNLRAGREQVAPVWVGMDLKPVAMEHGPALQPQCSIADAACDAWLLPGLWLTSIDELDQALQGQRRLIEALRALPRQAQLWSYCAGVALAAAAGRLDGRDATATWWLQPALAARFSRVHWQGVQSLVVDGRTITASGPSGYLPLMLDRLATCFPGDVLRDVQEVLMLPQPRTRHAAFHPVEVMTLRDPALRRLLLFAQRTPAQALNLMGAAEHLSVSVRTLCRQVKLATGIAAGDWLRRVKLSQAGEALRRTRAPIKSISEELGFASEGSLHRSFKSTTGLTPSAYRQAYTAMAFHIDTRVNDTGVRPR